MIKRVWLNLCLIPVWLLIAMGLLHYVANQNNTSLSELNANYLQTQGPSILLIALVFIFLFLFWSAKKDKFDLFRTGWRSPDNILIEIGGGVAMGLIMAVLYFAIVAPFQITLQNQFGDYVETGKTASIYIQQPIIFLIGNIFMAPFIEESLFRNYALRQLSPKFNSTSRILISSAAFGTLHFLGGFWYLLMNAVLVGIPFAFVADKRKNIIWTFAAHTTLNILEVIYFAY